MTQEDKDLLLKDLCARLPYNVYIYFKTKYRCVITDVLDGAIYTYIETHLLEDDGENEIDIIKPYLRPMSSIASLVSAKKWSSLSGIDLIDWYNANHIDYRGLIKKGLAIEAPEGMYNLKEK